MWCGVVDPPNLYIWDNINFKFIKGLFEMKLFDKVDRVNSLDIMELGLNGILHSNPTDRIEQCRQKSSDMVTQKVVFF